MSDQTTGTFGTATWRLRVSEFRSLAMEKTPVVFPGCRAILIINGSHAGYQFSCTDKEGGLRVLNEMHGEGILGSDSLEEHLAAWENMHT